MGNLNCLTIGLLYTPRFDGDSGTAIINLATVLTHPVLAAMPPAIEELERDLQEEVVDSDQDAEGEEETDVYQMDAQLQDAVHRAYSVDIAEQNKDEPPGNGQPAGEADAEGEPEDEANAGGHTEEAEPVGAVKLPDDASSGGEDAASDAADADPAFQNDPSSSEASDAEGEAWEGESNGREDAEADNCGRGNCM